MASAPTRIVVMIGNGFDIALSLKTRYKDFLLEYVRANMGNPSNAIRWLCSQIYTSEEGKDGPQWSDAEVAFAALPFGSEAEAVDVYSECSQHFTHSFAEYIKKQDERFVIPRDKRLSVRNEFIRHLFGIVDFMQPGHKAQSRFRIEDNGVCVDFLNFNYTSTLEQILDLGGSSLDEFEVPTDNGTIGKVSIGNVCHVHGRLDDSLIFGVDSPKLISNKEVCSYCKRVGGILKDRCEEQAGLTGRKTGMKILEGAKVLVTFGLSFGKSDTEWWHNVFRRVNNRDMQLIVCPYCEKENDFPQSAWELNNFYANNKKMLFRAVSAGDKNIIATIENFSASQVIVLKPSTIESESCDYLHLSNVAKQFTNPAGADPAEPL